MGQSLHLLLHNIYKLPIPPPTLNPHNPYIAQKQYRKVLIDYLLKIKNINEFTPTEQVFLPINNRYSSSSSSSKVEADFFLLASKKFFLFF